ncbi:MAG: hypothetical protein KBT39_13565 [Bacteroidales bacterium]|nr:hypothetical protein [Bacteroidales bacterium]
MKKYLFMAVAAIAALSSCSSDNDLLTGEAGKKALTFTATMEGSATRAIYNSTEKCAQWEAGDQISINGKTYSAESAGLTTTFTAEDDEAGEAPYKAYFACTYDGTTATLPAAVTETWADGKFNMPMYATSTNTELQFYNLCGVLKITVKSNQIDAVKKIKVSSANKAVSGAFSVDANNAAVLSEPNTVSNTLTVTYSEAVATTEGGVVFYVAIPAQTYQELKIELDADGNGFTKSMTTKSALDITVARKTIYPITFADNAPATKGTAEATINGSTVSVNWVQLWPGGPKFAEYNVGASRATEYGDRKTFREASAEPFFWGANWCTPSNADMNELIRAASNLGSTKVTCVYEKVGGVWGFTFTGKETGYTTNSMFLPCFAEFSSNSSGETSYWAGPAIDEERAWQMWLARDVNDDYWGSQWYDQFIDEQFYVRPVLSSSSNTTGDDQNSYSVTFNSSDFYFNGSKAVAQNSDVRLTLTPMEFSWGDGNQFKSDGILSIDAYSRPGLTITEIVYTGPNGSTTKTDERFSFIVINGDVMDDGTNLGNTFESVTVNYTKQ